MVGMVGRHRPSCVAGVGALVLLALTSGSRVINAQAPAHLFFVPGRNVNTAGPAPETPTPDLAGNPFHKQRNEASCDVSPNNPLLVLCANNDYRGIETFGDSWIGLSTSANGGLTWRSHLLAGFPAAPSGIGAADPVVRIVPGLGLVNYITMSRNDGRGTLALALLLERNRENGDRYEFFQTRLIGNGTPGRFNDKPAMTAVLNESGGFIDVGGRRVPRGTVHVVYSLFPGNDNNSSSQIFHLMSSDYGLTWTSPRKLSESLGINQGADVAIDGSLIVVAWRQVGDGNEPDKIVFTRSSDGGQTWTKAQELWQGSGRFFDQDTSALQFRTRSLPSLIHDGSALHALWSARGFAAHPEDARIVVSSSRDGSKWSAPVVVNAFAGRGHQIMPQVAVAGGRLQVNWIDTRNNDPGSFGRFIADFGEDHAGNRVPLDDPAQPPAFIYRQSADIMAAQAEAASTNGQPALTFTAPTQISRYRFGLVDGVRRQLEYNFVNARLFQRGNVPFLGDYHAVVGQRYRPSETTPGAWIRNTAPSTSHAIFYSAFTDNRDVQGYVWAGPPATSFTPAGSQEAEAGTDAPVACTPSGGTTPETTVWSPNDSARSRYQNVYAAATFPGLLVASPSASKPTGTLERAYVIFVQNLTAQDRTYRLSVGNQPADAPPAGTGRASFRPDDPLVPFASCVDGAACSAIDVTIARGSSVTRTVYLRSAQPRPRITVRVNEQGGAGQTGSVILNANPDIAEIETPEGGLPSILDFELYQPEILQRQSTVYSTGLINPDVTPVAGIQNPRIEYPRIEFPRIEYPRIEFPRIEYPRIEFDAVGNPRIEYPRIEYPRIEYSAVENPRIEFSPLTADDLASGPVGITEVTWPVTTDGANTTTAMSAKIFVNGTLTGLLGAQMLVTVPHFSTVTRTCDGQPVTIVENQVLVNTIVDPVALARTAGGPDTVNPPLTQPSFFVQPNQVAYVTLRLVGRADPLLARRAGVIVRSQPDASDGDESDEDDDPGAADTTPPVILLGGLAGGVTVEGNKPGGADVSLLVTASDESGESTLSCVRSGGATPATTPVATDGSAVFFALGAWQVTCNAADPFGNQATAGFPVTVVDTKPPVLTVPEPMTVEATASAGAAVTFAATAVDVVDATPTVACAPASGSTFPLGVTTVSCTASDDSGNSSVRTFTIAVRDTTPPSSLVAAVTPSILWPPNGALLPATVSGQALDNVSGVAAIEWAVIDEYRQYQPTGTAAVSTDGSFSFQVPLLADRRGADKDGRHYTIRLTAVDAAGNRLALAQPLVVNVHDQAGL